MKILTSCCPLSIAQVMLFAKPAPAPLLMETLNDPMWPCGKTSEFFPTGGCLPVLGSVRHTASCSPAGDLESCRSVLPPWWRCWPGTSPLGTPFYLYTSPHPLFFLLLGWVSSCVQQAEGKHHERKSCSGFPPMQAMGLVFKASLLWIKISVAVVSLPL